MSYACKMNSAYECDGCGKCSGEPKIVGECAVCGDLIYDYDERYDIEGELIHVDCLTDWAKKYEVVLI